MKSIVILFGIFIILAGLAILIDPDIIYNMIEDSMENKSLYITAIVVRLVLGMSLLLSAKESKFPVVIKVLGAIMILAAITFIFIGRESFQDLVSSIVPSTKPYSRIVAPFVTAFGVFLIYAYRKPRKLT